MKILKYMRCESSRCPWIPTGRPEAGGSDEKWGAAQVLAASD